MDGRMRAFRYSDLCGRKPIRSRLRENARQAVLFGLSLTRRMSTEREWVRFPYYHHVLDDERAGFEKQLRWMRRWGDFLSLDDALEALERPGGIGGCYFCVTFDDGFKNCATNAVPILADQQCPAAFFVPTDYVGCDLDEDWQVAQRFYGRTSGAYPLPLEFLSWGACRRMRDAGMTIGSHTCSHTRPADLDEHRLEAELRESKTRIERELGLECRYFACPWGRPGVDFGPGSLCRVVRRLGYRGTLTTARGPNYAGTDPYSIRRDHLVAGESIFPLRYFSAAA